MVDTGINADGFGMFARLTRPASGQLCSHNTKRHLRVQAVERVALIEPAERVMTDFALESPVTIAVDSLIDDALLMMNEVGVRALFAMRGDVAVGLITPWECMGDRVTQFLIRSGLASRSEVEVGHVMIPWDAVPTIDVPWLALATVADVRERFRRTGVSHFVVVEYADDGLARTMHEGGDFGGPALEYRDAVG
jgi:CBS domain-containing protein